MSTVLLLITKHAKNEVDPSQGTQDETPQRNIC